MCLSTDSDYKNKNICWKRRGVNWSNHEEPYSRTKIWIRPCGWLIPTYKIEAEPYKDSESRSMEGTVRAKKPTCLEQSGNAMAPLKSLQELPGPQGSSARLCDQGPPVQASGLVTHHCSAQKPHWNKLHWLWAACSLASESFSIRSFYLESLAHRQNFYWMSA